MHKFLKVQDQVKLNFQRGPCFALPVNFIFDERVAQTIIFYNRGLASRVWGWIPGQAGYDKREPGMTKGPGMTTSVTPDLIGGLCPYPVTPDLIGGLGFDLYQGKPVMKKVGR